MTAAGTPSPLLEVRDLSVRYGDRIVALQGVTLGVPAGGLVAVLGSNGAGKSTLLKAVSGVLAQQRGKITGGSIRLGGETITGWRVDRRVKAGVVQVPEGRRIFARLSVEENLRVGRYGNTAGRTPGDLARVYELFPVLAERRTQRAGLLSGGEQQMLALGRALMASPKILLLDEPSLGLAPRVIDQITELIDGIHRAGTAILIVEQNAAVALDLAQHAYVLAVGEVALSGPAEELKASDEVRRLYLGDVDADGPHLPDPLAAPGGTA